MNAERFLADPFVAGGRLYRTGDLARWLADGNLEYLGRADDQVKIRGNRVEPDEVRDRLAALPGVRDAAVVARDSAVRGTHLVGYYVAAAELDAGQLRAGLSATLPDFMLPAFFVRIDSLPLSANGSSTAGNCRHRRNRWRRLRRARRPRPNWRRCGPMSSAWRRSACTTTSTPSAATRS
ncbi:AMP-binding protein [Pseudomonas aeruginosa]|nr:AMP-binding protein [Pseudomonas aeruginosa]